MDKVLNACLLLKLVCYKTDDLQISKGSVQGITPALYFISKWRNTQVVLQFMVITREAELSLTRG